MTEAAQRKTKQPWADGTPAGDRYYGEIARDYLADRVHKPVWNAEHEAVRRFLDRLPEVRSVLDVPFGTGRFVPLYLERGLDVAGIDASADMLAVARQELGRDAMSLDIRQGDALALPYPDQRFDLSVCIRFLESIIPFAMVEPCLVELRRVTRGHTIVRMNTRRKDVPPIAPPLPEQPIKDRLLKPAVIDLFRRAGWEPVESIVADKKQTDEKRVWLLQAG